MPNWTLYTFLEWPADLAFATAALFGKPRSEMHCSTMKGVAAKRYAPLTESEFNHWPEQCRRGYARSPRSITIGDGS